MAIEQLQRSCGAVHPRMLYSHHHHQTDALRQNTRIATASPDYLAQLEALLREHEPHKVRQASDLLRIYAGMEQELLQCYRHHYTGTGGFRVMESTPSRNQHHQTVFSLPKAAIATYLREKLRARRAQSSSSSSSPSIPSAKGDDMRSPEMLLCPAATAASVPSAERHRNRGDQDAPVRIVTPLTSRQTNRTSCGAVRPLPMLHCDVPRSLPSTTAGPAAAGVGHTMRRA